MKCNVTDVLHREFIAIAHFQRLSLVGHLQKNIYRFQWPVSWKHNKMHNLHYANTHKTYLKVQQAKMVKALVHF